MDQKGLRDVWDRHRGKITGTALGLALTVSMRVVGFWWTLLFAVGGGIGYWLGRRLDEEKESVIDVLDRILPPGRR